MAMFIGYNIWRGEMGGPHVGAFRARENRKRPNSLASWQYTVDGPWYASESVWMVPGTEDDEASWTPSA